MKRLDVEEMVDKMKLMARENLQRDKYLTFCALVFTPSGLTPVLMDPLLKKAEVAYEKRRISDGQAIKATMWSMLRALLKEKQAIGVIVVGEAWMRDAKPSEVIRMGGDEPGMAKAIAVLPRFMPDRREIMYLTWEFRLEDGAKVAGFFDQTFTREGGGKKQVIKLGECKSSWMKHGESWTEGMAANLLE